MGVSSSEPSFTVFHIGRAAGATTGDNITAAHPGAAA